MTALTDNLALIFAIKKL